MTEIGGLSNTGLSFALSVGDFILDNDSPASPSVHVARAGDGVEVVGSIISLIFSVASFGLSIIEAVVAPVTH